MSKLYNTQGDFAREISIFIKNVFPAIRKTQLNILPYILLGIILSESTLPLDIAKSLKDKFSLVQIDSVVKRIRRFFNNKLFDPYSFYESIISYVISNYKVKHSYNKVHIIFDHMFSQDKYTIFMISMRVGKQSIPLWFRAFKGNKNSLAFQESLIIEGVSFVSSLFDKNVKLIFLADRFFNSTSLMKFIDSLGHVYRFRLKHNHKIFVFDKKEKHYIWKWLSELRSLEYHSVIHKNIYLTHNLYKTNIVISKRHGYDEPWMIVTNGNCNQALIDYSYRFGGIECLFKNQKSNGFYLERTVNASQKSFQTMYTLACLASLFLTILGADFSKNSKCYKNVKIKTHTIINGVKTRVISLFNTGLILFKFAFNSLRYIRIPFKFILYDI